MIKYILFDLDGTLLPMDFDVFVQHYFGLLAKKLAMHGYEPKRLIDAVWHGTMAMITNDGEKSNENVFWDDFSLVYGKDARCDIPLFDEYYGTDFDKVRSVCGYNEKVPRLIKELKEKGFSLVLATNPVFPAIATEKRMAWAGLSQDDFLLYTTYENSNYCKPSLNYYREIANKIGAKADECLMVGNDVGDDMVARELGMKVFLLTDCLINKKDVDISIYPNGSIDALSDFIDKMNK